MRRQAIFFLILLTVLSFAQAAQTAQAVESMKGPTFFIKAIPIEQAISIDDIAKFKLTVFNNNTFDDTYLFLVKDAEWAVGTDPSTDYWNGLGVQAGETGETILKMSTGYNFPTGQLPGIPLILKSKRTGEEQSVILKIEILPRTKFPSDISAKFSSDSPHYIDPRQKVSLKINVKNNNGAKHSGLELRLKGKYLSRNLDMSLSPFENKAAEFTIDFDKMTSPGKDTLMIEIIKDGKIIAQDQKNIEIIEYSEPFKRTQSEAKSFLKTTTRMTLENDGNVVKQQKITFPVTSFQRFFTVSEPQAEFTKASEESENSGYAWDVMLSSGEKTEIIVVRNLMPLLYIALFVVIYLMAYFILRSPLTITKEVTDVLSKEGGISEVKLTIKIRNRGSKQRKDVRLIERIPEITNLVLEKDMIKPTRQYKYSEGTAIEWRFAELEAGEERIVTYKIKSRLIIMGGLRLKPSVLRFEKRKVFSTAGDVYAP